MGGLGWCGMCVCLSINLVGFVEGGVDLESMDRWMEARTLGGGYLLLFFFFIFLAY